MEQTPGEGFDRNHRIPLLCSSSTQEQAHTTDQFVFRRHSGTTSRNAVASPPTTLPPMSTGSAAAHVRTVQPAREHQQTAHTPSFGSSSVARHAPHQHQSQHRTAPPQHQPSQHGPQHQNHHQAHHGAGAIPSHYDRGHGGASMDARRFSAPGVLQPGLQYPSSGYGGARKHTTAEPIREDMGKRKKLPPAAILALRIWLCEHSKQPYPNEEQKQELMRKTQLTRSQINNWFSGARRRMLKDPQYCERVALTVSESLQNPESATRLRSASVSYSGPHADSYRNGASPSASPCTTPSASPSNSRPGSPQRSAAYPSGAASNVLHTSSLSALFHAGLRHGQDT